MIKARIFRNQKQEIWGFEVQGHSGYAETGSDIICAAVSVLALNTANSLETLVELSPKVQSADGYLFCEVSEIRDGQISSQMAELLFCSFEQGLNSIADSYGEEYLSVSIYQKA